MPPGHRACLLFEDSAKPLSVLLTPLGYPCFLQRTQVHCATGREEPLCGPIFTVLLRPYAALMTGCLSFCTGFFSDAGCAFDSLESPAGRPAVGVLQALQERLARCHFISQSCHGLGKIAKLKLEGLHLPQFIFVLFFGR